MFLGHAGLNNKKSVLRLIIIIFQKSKSLGTYFTFQEGLDSEKF